MFRCHGDRFGEIQAAHDRKFLYARGSPRGVHLRRGTGIHDDVPFRYWSGVAGVVERAAHDHKPFEEFGQLGFGAQG
ncbi:Uncharacterised protein [Mycobacteroides abscessus subsp. abscessus]|nr:Uncharacterised protein [Mycobacteroides abscessus subsp. abscessus]